MRSKSLVLILIAVVCGLVASIGISQVMEAGGGSQGVATEKIYVAMSDIDIGKKLDESNLKLEAWPKDKVPQGAARKLDEVKDKFPRQRFYPGEPILVAKLTDNPGNTAIKIPEGHRVVSVKVGVETINTALLSPGDHVDVLVFLKKNADIPQTIAKTILKNVCVFAVGSETERTIDKDGKAIIAQTVSIVVTPHQGRMVLLAMELGSVKLFMRRPDDPTTETDDDESETGIEGMLGSRPDDSQSRRPLAGPPAQPKSLLEMLKSQTAGNNSRSTSIAPDAAAENTFTVIVMNPEGKDVYQFLEPESSSKHQPPDRIGGLQDFIGSTIELSGETVNGQDFDWKSYRGRPVVVMIWSTTCAGCRQETTLLRKVYDLYHEQGFDVVGMNVDRNTPGLAGFIADFNIPWANLHGTETQQFVSHHGIMSTPTFMLISDEGKLIAVGRQMADLAVHLDLALRAQGAATASGTTRARLEPGARDGDVSDTQDSTTADALRGE